ncbi:TPA: SMI1/KNR4 family protein [Bacillus cereus]|uniref:SMI1/KNR4 family protein n=1 Tax=Bacillus cereus TaxID=1396 RepID=UPI001CF66218|nr:SMI1/KNR4 family protein [Bacillus cereus]MCB4336337.1 SMI1/KNR4 family protein [Bacillus cereus]HDR6286682.1 SMI1/KNR4 family protein [Bacillus cereus]
MRNDLTWPVPDETVSAEYIDNVGKGIGYIFPSDYVECATNNNGSAVLPYKFEIDTITKAFGTLLSYDVDSREYIVKVYNQYISTLPNELVPFAFDPAGNLICFDYKNHKEDPIVVFWEHEGAWEKETLMESEGITAEEAEERARENVYHIANNFTEFLNKLHD